MFDLTNLARIQQRQSRSISAENPDGAVAGGALDDPGGQGPARTLGTGWKVRPCITLHKGETVTLADIDGPGNITHIWITGDQKVSRDVVLRMYWDGESEPSVEVPLADFFAVTHGVRYNVNSLPVAVNPTGAFNCYWPMPFRSHCKITVENQRWEDIGGFFYTINYELGEVPDDAAYFHAQWRRATTDRANPDYVILSDVRGTGHYVGTVLAWTQLSDGWWGEGEIKFFIDSDTNAPTICGTGTEDYFGGAWGFLDTFSTAFLGYPYWNTLRPETHRADQVPKHGLYRWHIPDPIRFTDSLRVTIQALGWWPDGRFQPLADDIASIAYWYQTEPHTPFPAFPPAEERWPR